MFVNDLKRGLPSEQAVASYYSDDGYFVQRVDKKNRKYYDMQCIKIDAKVVIEDIKVEVKFDEMSKKTKNACFEIQDSKGEKSGIYGTRADVIVYHFPEHGLYRIPVKKFKRWLKRREDDLDIRSGGDGKRFKMIIMPLTSLFDIKFVEKIADVDKL